MKTNETSKQIVQDEIDNPKRGFTGVWIPRHVWEHPELNCVERCLFGEVQALAAKTGWCFATNAYLGSTIGVSADRVKRMVGHLKSLALLEEGPFTGRVRLLRSLSDTLADGVKTPRLLGCDLEDWSKTPGLMGQKHPVSGGENTPQSSVSSSIERNGGSGAEAPPPPGLVGIKIRPGTEEAVAYGLTIGLPKSEVEAWFDHFDANGWKIGGRTAMKDWRASLRTWKRNASNWGTTAKLPSGAVRGQRPPPVNPLLHPNGITDEDRARSIAKFDRKIARQNAEDAKNYGKENQTTANSGQP